MLKTCPGCGTKMAMDHRRCPHCGVAQVEEEAGMGEDMRVTVRTVTASAGVSHPPVEQMTAEERAHLGLEGNAR